MKCVYGHLFLLKIDYLDARLDFCLGLLKNRTNWVRTHGREHLANYTASGCLRARCQVLQLIMIHKPIEQVAKNYISYKISLEQFHAESFYYIHHQT